MKKKIRRWTLSGALLTGLTFGLYQGHDTISQNLENINTPQYHQETSVEDKQDYMKRLETRFLWYQFTKDNNQIETLYKKLFSYDFGNIDKNKIDEFVKDSKRLLREIVNVQWSKYRENSVKFNAIQSEIIPNTKEYIYMATLIIEKKVGETKDLKQLKKEVKK